MGIYKKAPSKRKNIQAPEVPSATYPGERVQVDVKFFPFKIELVQTDNGFELTNKLSWNAFNKNKETLFEKRLKELKIEYHTIQPHTPTQNGKVERSHRKDQERFYYKRIFINLEDLKEKGRKWLKEYNNFPMRPLN